MIARRRCYRFVDARNAARMNLNSNIARVLLRTKRAGNAANFWHRVSCKLTNGCRIGEIDTHNQARRLTLRHFAR